MRMWPKSLAGQLTATLVLALVVAQVIAFVLFAGERTRAVRFAYRENVIGRTATLVQLIQETPDNLHARILAAASTRLVRFSEADTPAVPVDSSDLRAALFAHELSEALDVEAQRVRVNLSAENFDPGGALGWRERRKHHGRDGHDGHDDRGEEDSAAADRPLRNYDHALRRARWIAFSVQLKDGTWLNALTGPPPLPPPFGATFLASLLLSAVAVGVTGLLVARRMARPVRRLADAAERAGRGEKVEPLPEEGPDEARRSTRAFNEMFARLDRFIRDRTHMLAAISHDLRTPLTSLRLRAELIDDAETRDKLVETIDEMQHMSEAALAFIRAEGKGEATREVDLAALAQSLVDDLQELGHAVTMEESPRMVVRCRPGMLRRAIVNVVENAAKHGGSARLRLQRDQAGIRILVEDDGPGLAEEDLERVFEPFVRTDASRSRDGGGIGLGLAIARTAVRGHGGDIVLENRPEGGLRAIITLPVDSLRTK